MTPTKRCGAGNRSGQSLVIFTHPPVLVDPRERPLYYPPPRQHDEPLRWQELFRQSTFAPSLDHSLAHAISTPSGAALRARLTISTLQPSVFFTHSLRP